MAKKGLGRGLDVLLGDAPKERSQTEAKEIEQLKLPIEFIIPDATQPRKEFADEAIAELAGSIKVKGILQPILVRPVGGEKDKYQIVAGERRWRAAQRAQLHQIPVIIRDLSDEETAEIALIENIQRVDLNPIEEAEAYQHLVKTHDRTQAMIAEAVGKSRSHVANIMRLNALPALVRKKVREGALSMGHARALLGVEGCETIAADIIKKDLSVRETEAIVKQIKAPKDSSKKISTPEDIKKKQSTAKDADTKALEREISESLGLEVAVEHDKKSGGSVVIDYQNLDQLDEICRRLMNVGI